MTAYSILEPADAALYRSFAFPRHVAWLLHDLGAGGGTIAVGATTAGLPCGLAIAGMGDRDVASLHAVVVGGDLRRQGIGTALVERLEGAAQARGARWLIASHRGDRASSAAVSRLLARRRFELVRSVIEIVYPVAAMLHAPALDVECPGAAVVDFSPERLAPLLDVADPSGMAPANVAPDDHDPTLATLVAVDGVTAACIMARRIGADTVYMSLLFVRPELRRSHLGAFAVRAFLRRMLDQGIVRFSCEVSADNDACLGLAVGGVGAYAEHRALVHQLRKPLA